MNEFTARTKHLEFQNTTKFNISRPCVAWKYKKYKDGSTTKSRAENSDTQMVKHNRSSVVWHRLWHLTTKTLGRAAVRQEQKAALYSGLNQL